MAYRLPSDATIFKALGDENRLAILRLLMDGEKSGCVLLSELKITQPTLSHHMKILCDAGIVDANKDGKWMCYSICAVGSSRLRTLLDDYTLPPDGEKGYSPCKCEER